MSLLEDLKKKLKPETFSALEEELGDDFNYDLVPRSRLNKVIKQRNELKDQVEDLQSQIPEQDDDDEGATKKKSAKGKGTEPKTYTQEELEAELQKKQNELKLTQAVKDKLKESGAQDIDLVYGLIDASKVSFNNKNELTGLEDQLKTLTESKSFLFKDNVPGGTGKEGSGGSGGTPDAIDAAIANVFGGYGITTTTDTK